MRLKIKRGIATREREISHPANDAGRKGRRAKAKLRAKSNK
jgi:hypothetical protein